MLTAQEIDSGAPMQEVADLLPSHFLGREAYAFLHDAVVGSKNDVLRMMQGRRQGLLHQSYLEGKCLQHTQRAFGLGQVVYLIDQCFPDGHIRTGYIERFHAVIIMGND
ncbi:unknown [Bacteroides sp. CAG:633]|nr:unknown [Bacteroides sp. CAG:633]